MYLSYLIYITRAEQTWRMAFLNELSLRIQVANVATRDLVCNYIILHDENLWNPPTTIHSQRPRSLLKAE